jgi:hypothetical protein
MNLKWFYISWKDGIRSQQEVAPSWVLEKLLNNLKWDTEDLANLLEQLCELCAGRVSFVKIRLQFGEVQIVQGEQK